MRCGVARYSSIAVSWVPHVLYSQWCCIHLTSLAQKFGSSSAWERLWEKKKQRKNNQMQPVWKGMRRGDNANANDKCLLCIWSTRLCHPNCSRVLLSLTLSPSSLSEKSRWHFFKLKQPRDKSEFQVQGTERFGEVELFLGTLPKKSFIGFQKTSDFIRFTHRQCSWNLSKAAALLNTALPKPTWWK